MTGNMNEVVATTRDGKVVDITIDGTQVHATRVTITQHACDCAEITVVVPCHLIMADMNSNKTM